MFTDFVRLQNAGNSLDLTGTIQLVGQPGHPFTLGGMADVYQGQRPGTVGPNTLEYVSKKLPDVIRALNNIIFVLPGWPRLAGPQDLARR